MKRWSPVRCSASWSSLHWCQFLVKVFRSSSTSTTSVSDTTRSREIHRTTWKTRDSSSPSFHSSTLRTWRRLTVDFWFLTTRRRIRWWTVATRQRVTKSTTRKATASRCRSVTRTFFFTIFWFYLGHFKVFDCMSDSLEFQTLFRCMTSDDGSVGDDQGCSLNKKWETPETQGVRQDLAWIFACFALCFKTVICTKQLNYYNTLRIIVDLWFSHLLYSKIIIIGTETENKFIRPTLSLLFTWILVK